jgi:mannosyltransferase
VLDPRVGRGEGVLLALCVAVGSVLRFTPATPLWLDEALTVNVASAPLADIAGLLERDGHPPLYYYVLHLWMEIVGTGASAVRALSAIFGLAAIAMIFVVGRRLGGARLGAWSAAVLAVMPYGIRYSSEARMYELVTLLVLVGWWLVDRALAAPPGAPADAPADPPADGAPRPTDGVARRDAPVARWVLVALWLVSGALLLTHYWAIFFLAACGLGLVVCTVRVRRTGSPERFRAHLQVTLAVALGGVWFTPWVSTFRYQAEHTGTPWAPASRPTRILSESLVDFAGGVDPEPILLLGLCAVLAVLGGFASSDGDRVCLGGLRPGWPTRLLWVLGGTLGVGAVASLVSSAAFAGRYASVVFPFWVLLVAAGLVVIPGVAARVATMLLLVLLAGATVALHLDRDRTQAGQVAAVLNAEATPGDLVVVCPDQLGPGLSRLVRAPGVRVVRYPDLGDPRFVDWVDYADRYEPSPVAAFADRVLLEAGADDIWLVWAGTYRVAGPQCDELSARLAAMRPGTSPVVGADPVANFESASLLKLVAR